MLLRTHSKRLHEFDAESAIAIPKFLGFLAVLFKFSMRKLYFDFETTERTRFIVYHDYEVRDDYKDIIESFSSILKNVEGNKSTVKTSLSLLSLFKSIDFFSINDIRQDLTNGNSFLQSLKFQLLKSAARRDYVQISEALSCCESKIVVTFCDSMYFDNIVTQASKVNGLLTMTLQHGQYHIVNKNVPENQALINLRSDYLLAWGEATKNEYEQKVGGDTLVEPLGICSRNYRSVVPYEENKSFEVEQFAIYLNADNCKNANEEMIRLVMKVSATMKVGFTLMYHPNNNKELYSSIASVSPYYNDSINNDENRIMNVVYTSGVLVKLLAKAHLFLLFKDDETPELFYENLVGFCNERELLNLACRFNSESAELKLKLAECQRFFIKDECSLKNYENFINNILKRGACE